MKKVTMVIRLWNRRFSFPLTITRSLIKVLVGLRRVRFGPRLKLWPSARPLSKRHEAFPVVLVLLGINAGLLVWAFPVGAGGSASGSPSEPPRLEEKEQERKLLIIDIGELNKGRPVGFYRSMVEIEPSVCQPLLSSLNKPQEVSFQSKNFSTDILLGNEFSVTWTDLQWIYGPEPVSRTVVDLNNDGVRDVIYRKGAYMGESFFYRLHWTDSFPEEEKTFTLEREREVFGKKTEDTPNKFIFENDVVITNKSVPQSLPESMKLPWGAFFDIVRVKGRYLVTLTDSKYWDRQLRVFVFRSHSKREHSLMCVFSSNYIIRSFQRRQKEQGG